MNFRCTIYGTNPAVAGGYKGTRVYTLVPFCTPSVPLTGTRVQTFCTRVCTLLYPLFIILDNLKLFHDISTRRPVVAIILNKVSFLDKNLLHSGKSFLDCIR